MKEAAKKDTQYPWLIDIVGVVSVYAYDVPHRTIPLVIVSKKVKWEILRGATDWDAWWIILTKKDVEDGQDAFALRFLHMKKHAKHIAWKDMLKKIEIKQPQARLALEGMLRVTLIDMREILMQEIIDEDMIDMLALSIDRIASYTQLVSGSQKAWKKHVETCLDICQKDVCSHDELEVIYHVIEKMTKEVDQL